MRRSDQAGANTHETGTKPMLTGAMPAPKCAGALRRTVIGDASRESHGFCTATQVAGLGFGLIRSPSCARSARLPSTPRDIRSRPAERARMINPSRLSSSSGVAAHGTTVATSPREGSRPAWAETPAPLARRLGDAAGIGQRHRARPPEDANARGRSRPSRRCRIGNGITTDRN